MSELIDLTLFPVVEGRFTLLSSSGYVGGHQIKFPWQWI